MADFAIGRTFLPPTRLDFNDRQTTSMDVFLSPVTDPVLDAVTMGGVAPPPGLSMRGTVTSDADPTFHQTMSASRHIDLEGKALVTTAQAGTKSFSSRTADGTTTLQAEDGRSGQQTWAMQSDGLHTETRLGDHVVTRDTRFGPEGFVYQGLVRNVETGEEVPYHIASRMHVSTGEGGRPLAETSFEGYFGSTPVEGKLTADGGSMVLERHVGEYHVRQEITPQLDGYNLAP